MVEARPELVRTRAQEAEVPLGSHPWFATRLIRANKITRLHWRILGSLVVVGSSVISVEKNDGRRSQPTLELSRPEGFIMVCMYGVSRARYERIRLDMLQYSTRAAACILYYLPTNTNGRTLLPRSPVRMQHSVCS